MRIEIDSVSFFYTKSKKVLDDISFCMTDEKIYVLTGQNGSGKTTLTKLICGLISPSKGYVSIDGEPVRMKNAGLIAKKIGYMFQKPDMQFFASTVFEELAFPFELNGNLNEKTEEKINETLDLLKLKDLKDRFPLTMSVGEKQRLGLATIVVRDVEFLILDEPTASIDAEGKLFLASFVNDFVKKGGGALIITHDEEILKLLNNPEVLLLHGGKICV